MSDHLNVAPTDADLKNAQELIERYPLRGKLDAYRLAQILAEHRRLLLGPHKPEQEAP